MNLYLVYSNYELGKIEECEVVKETEKTYTIEVRGWGESRILKSNMTMYNRYVCKTYEEARAKLKEVLLDRIKSAEKTIENATNNIVKYKTMLEDLEKGGAE